MRIPGPLRAFFHRIAAKKSKPVAAVATARKLAVVIWHMLTKGQDYTWVRPALLAWKMRSLELAAGQASRRGQPKGSAAVYSLKAVREAERQMMGQVEEAYRRFVANWRARPKPKPS